MNLFETLRSLRSVEPDQDYTRRSRLEILHAPQAELPWYRTLVLGLQQTGRQPVAVLAVLVLVFAASIGAARLFAPSSGLASLDTRALEAEAQAVDIQIALANLQYQALAEQQAAASGRSVAASGRTTPAGDTAAKQPTASSSSTDTPIATTPSSAVMGEMAPTTTRTNILIDRALDELSE